MQLCRLLAQHKLDPVKHTTCLFNTTWVKGSGYDTGHVPEPAFKLPGTEPIIHPELAGQQQQAAPKSAPAAQPQSQGASAASVPAASGASGSAASAPSKVETKGVVTTVTLGGPKPAASAAVGNAAPAANPNHQWTEMGRVPAHVYVAVLTEHWFRESPQRGQPSEGLPWHGVECVHARRERQPDPLSQAGCPDVVPPPPAILHPPRLGMTCFPHPSRHGTLR